MQREILNHAVDNSTLRRRVGLQTLTHTAEEPQHLAHHHIDHRCTVIAYLGQALAVDDHIVRKQTISVSP